MLQRRNLLATGALLPFAARAQERVFTRPLRMIIPVGVAGVTDVVGRILAEDLRAQGVAVAACVPLAYNESRSRRTQHG